MIRAFYSGMRIHLVHLLRSPFDMFAMLVWPIVYATIAYYLIGTDGNPKVLFTASLGAAVMIMWSQVIVGSGFALDQQRMQGTLELLVAAPVPMPVILLPITVAMATIGLLSMVVTLLWGRFLFGIDVNVVHPVLFLVAVPVTVVSVGAVGFLLSVTVVRYRSAWALGSALELPVWLVAGFLVPIGILPDWVRPLSWLLAPTWGVRAIREAALGGNPVPEIGLCLLVGAGYLALGVLAAESVLQSARRHATLALS